MAGARYHILPEEGRPSTDTMADDSDRLLGPLDISSPSTPKKPFTINYHPTFFLRVIVFALILTTFILYISSSNGYTIPAVVFLAIAMARNLLVLLQHFGEFIKIRIRIEFVGREVSAGGRRKETRTGISALGRRSIQLAIDYFLIIVLLVTSLTTFYHATYYYWDRECNFPGSIVCWVALPIYAIAALDMGKPSRISFTTTIHLNMGKKKDDHPTRIASRPEIYTDGDLETGVIAVDDDEEARVPVQPTKTRDDSP